MHLVVTALEELLVDVTGKLSVVFEVQLDLDPQPVCFVHDVVQLPGVDHVVSSQSLVSRGVVLGGFESHPPDAHPDADEVDPARGELLHDPVKEVGAFAVVEIPLVGGVRQSQVGRGTQRLSDGIEEGAVLVGEVERVFGVDSDKPVGRGPREGDAFEVDLDADDVVFLPGPRNRNLGD